MRFLLYSSLLLTTPLLAQRVAEVEPNDTPATAQAVAMGVQVDCNLVAAENDYFSITTTGGQVRFTISNTTDTRLEILDAAGAVILAGNDDSRGLASDITINLAAGAYIVRVFGFGATTTGLYSLDVSLEHAAKTFTQIEAEPNDTVATANVLAPVLNSVQLNGNLSGAADVDVFQLVLTAPRTGLFFQVTEGDAPWTSQHRIELWDAAGVPVVAATLGTNAADSGTFTFRTATTRVWPAGTYHVVIRNRVAVLAYNPVPFGNYRLEIGIMPMNTGAVVPEAPEPNESIATATPLPAGAQGTGNISISTGPDASDWWGPIVVGPGGSVLTFQTANAPVGSIADTTLRLWQVAYPATVPPTAVLALTATAGNILDPTSHARAVVTFFVPGFTYYVEVISPGTLATQAGNYLLEVSSNEPAMYVASSYAILAANATCGVAPFPTLTRQFTNENPTTGQTFSRQATNIASTLGLLIQGLDNITPLDMIITGLVPAPATCFLNVSPLVISTVVAPGGTAELTMNIPPSVALRGFIMWEQIVEIESFAPFAIQMGNFARILVGERSY
ncbi:MAG TPA: T9SS type A sorting domain-containing protein [Planctomycetota bacterium]|nr:T9SS type A sorting domain-containing protein [Planctomycetota bacterium]